MINILALTQTITDWQQFVEQTKSHTTKSKSINTHSRLLHISKQISQLKKELDRSFPELGDLQETVATYNLYRRLETLQQQINNIEE
jgi:hypothetical protein